MPTEVNGEILINIQTAFGSQAVPVPVTGSVVGVPSTSGLTTTTVRQPVSVDRTLFKASDPTRVGLTIFNNSPGGANLFVKLGAFVNIGAGTESFTKKIAPGGYYEVPFHYTGSVEGIWDGADANGEALLVEQFVATTPLIIPSNEGWWRSDQGISFTTSMSFWADSGGLGRTLAQPTLARRPDYVAGINGLPVARFNTGGGDSFLSWVNTFSIDVCTIFAVVRFTAQADGTYQVFIHRSSQATPYMSGVTADGSTYKKPMLYTNAPNGIAASQLVTGTPYLLKYTTDKNTKACTTQINNGTESTSTSAIAFTGGPFLTIGFDPAVVATQDLISDLAELMIYSKDTTPAEDAAMWAYVQGRYAI
jgi:hypothetical protein